MQAADEEEQYLIQLFIALPTCLLYGYTSERFQSFSHSASKSNLVHMPKLNPIQQISMIQLHRYLLGKTLT